MSLRTKTKKQTIEWINASNFPAGKKKHIVATILKGGYSGADLAYVKSVDDLKDMGFRFTSKSLLELINSAAIQSKQNDAEKIRAKVKEQMAKHKKNDESKLFSIKYKYGGKSFMTYNKFSMNTKVSEFIYVLAHNELGIDPTKTKVLFLSDKWTDQVHKTLGEYNFSPIIECVVSFSVRGAGSYHKIKKGLNYGGQCEEKSCAAYEDPVTHNREFGESIYVLYEYFEDKTKCPACNNTFKVKQYILYKCDCEVTFKRKGKQMGKKSYQPRNEEKIRLDANQAGDDEEGDYEYLKFSVHPEGSL